RARRDADLDRDRTDLVGRTTVGALLLDRDALANHVLLRLRECELCGLAPLGVALALRLARELADDPLLELDRRVLARELVLDRRRMVEVGAEAAVDLVVHALVDGRRRDLGLRLAGQLTQLPLRLTELLDLGVGDVERVE